MTLPAPIAIVGCGLIGGSLLRALHRQGTPLIAIDRDAAARQLIHAQLGIQAADSLHAIGSARIVVLATPVGVLLEQLPEVAQVLSGTRGVIITDVAGIKRPVLDAMRAHLSGIATFVGSHPMAGKERGGFIESDADLYQGRMVALCGEPVPAVEAMWHAVGARTIVCDADVHDAAVARVSHLPHLVAASLSTVAGQGDALSDQLAAGGLRDTTRVAEDPTIREALVRNPHVAALARDVAAQLLAYADALEAGQPIDRQLDAAAKARRRLYR